MPVSERITKLIKIKKYSNQFIGDQIGSSKTTIGNFKNGKTDPSVKFIMYLIKEFPNLNLDWLFTGEGEMFKQEGIDESNYKKTERELEMVKGRLAKIENKFDKLKPLLKEQNQMIREVAKEFNGMDLPNLMEKVIKEL